jgi:hypothetical protein
MGYTTGVRSLAGPVTYSPSLNPDRGVGHAQSYFQRVPRLEAGRSTATSALFPHALQFHSPICPRAVVLISLFDECSLIDNDTSRYRTGCLALKFCTFTLEALEAKLRWFLAIVTGFPRIFQSLHSVAATYY